MINDTFDLFLALGASEDSQIDFPIIYTYAHAGSRPSTPRRHGAGTPRRPLFGALLGTFPAPSYLEDAPLQTLVTNLDHDPHRGAWRWAGSRAWSGAGQAVTHIDREAWRKRGSRSSRVLQALKRVEADGRPRRDIRRGRHPEVHVGETLAVRTIRAPARDAGGRADAADDSR